MSVGDSIRVLKVGGNQLDDGRFLLGLAAHLKELEAVPIVVHGGGRAIDRLQGRLGMEPVKVDGLRRSQPEELEAALMALCGAVNKRLVAALIGEGVPAVGLAGVDGGLLRVEKLDHPSVDLGYVGEIVEVQPNVLMSLVDRRMVPVVAPLSLGPAGQIFNVNADQVAAAIARSVSASSLDFVSNVPGVVLDGVALETLDPHSAQDLIAEGRINGGMVPKVRAALEAVGPEVPQARIVDLPGLAAGGGTVFRSQGAARE